MYNIIMLSPDEKFLQFLDPDLCEVKETISTGGLRTLELEYKFQNFKEDKQLFKLGNKLWFSGDVNLQDCLYVINTAVKEDIYKENSFTLELEEVLVELNNAPLVSHLDLTTYSSVFHTRNTDTNAGGKEVRVDWNSLNFWFGDFFNIGVVQDCLNSDVQWIPFFGTYNLMTLLRFIEEQTGNVFVTRYEKDQLTNTIHRYLDFLNPINVSKDWELHIEYDMLGIMKSHTYNSDDWTETETLPDKATDVVRYTNSHITAESLIEAIKTYDPETDEALNQYDTLDTNYKWVEEDETVVDEGTIKHYTSYIDIIPDTIVFQIVTELGEVLNADGVPASEDDDNILQWVAEDLDYSSSNTNVLMSLSSTGTTLGLVINDKSYAVVGVGGKEPPYVSYTDKISEDTTTENQRDDCAIPDDCFFEIYDAVNKMVLFRTCINRSIGKVHSEILDFGFNLDNMVYDIDESDVYTGVAPLLSYSADKASSNGMTRANFTDLLTRYRNLTITKGLKIPMIMQKVTVQASTLEAAKMTLGNYDEGSGANKSKTSSNYWIRPYKPNDNIDSTTASNSTWEFLRATAYWNAPYPKKPGDLAVTLDDTHGLEYANIYGRGDARSAKGATVYDKIGTTEDSDSEDIYSIYNQCALFLKDHCTPNIDLEVDVSNLKDGTYNKYDIHDKVYIKIPDTNELITARVIETSKEAHDISANTIKLSNYSTNTIKHIQDTTTITATNINYKYPSSKTLTARIINLDYNDQDPYSIPYPTNKLISFTLYKVKDGSRTFMKIYTKVSTAEGYVTLPTKLGPGDYEVDISFGGDEEFSECSLTVKINVSGTIKSKKKTTSKTKQKTTKKSKTVQKTTYYDKYGRSPDKKKIIGIGKRSASRDPDVSYANFYATEFKNYCPKCHSYGTLVYGIFWASDEHKNYGYFPGNGHNEGSSAEGAFFCKKCDGDWSAFGNEHGYGNTKLTITKKTTKSSKADVYKLKKGKYIYNQPKTTNKAKNNTNTKNRKIVGKLSQTIKNLALSIVDNKTGHEALMAIVEWMDKKIWYSGYYNFTYSPEYVAKRKHGNCCDQTRLFLQLCDGAGLTEYYHLYYCWVSGHVYAIVKNKKTGKWVYVDCASDYHTAWGYVCRGYTHGSPSSKYPNRPF